MAEVVVQRSFRLPSLQVLRFVAAMGVVWEHAATRADPHNLTGGSAGVDLFFVLSGYVIAHAARTRSETFLRDRLTRIYPVYWLWAVPWLAFAAWQEPLSGWRLFTTATLLPNPTADPIYSYVGVGWTLSFELLFYAVVWLVLRGLDWRILALGDAGLAVASILTKSPILHFLGSPMAVEFALGVLAYRLGRGRPILGALALAVACAVFPFLPKQLSLPQAALSPYLGLGRAALLGPLAFLVVWGAAQFRCSGRFWRPLVLLGDASYSIYLSHLVLMLVAVQLLGPAIPAAILAAATVAIGLLAYLFAERPLLHLARRSWPRPDPIAQAEAA